MTRAMCVSAATYGNALTRGKQYTILARDDEKAQVQVRADNGRLRWFPLSCFDISGRDAPELVRIVISESVAEASKGSIEVEAELSDGQRRWCFFVTPQGLSDLTQAHLRNGRLHMYGAPHIIVVSAISQNVIEEALHYIDSQNELIDSTLAID